MKSLLFALPLVLLVGCASPAAPRSAPAVQRAAPLTAIVTLSDLAVGPNHFALALRDERNQPVAEAPLHLAFFALDGPEPVLVAEADATWVRPGSEWNRGVYKAPVRFERAGPHGVEATVMRADGPPQVTRTRFEVQPASASPPIGTPAPRSQNLTVRDAVDPVELCTATAETCAATAELRQLTIAEAITLGKPTVVLFATPGFCTSQTCGPQLEVFQSVAQRYRDRASFIHVEIFKDPQARTVNATVQEWNLPSEPWVFVLDSAGRVADKFEAITAPEEIEQALRPLLA